MATTDAVLTVNNTYPSASGPPSMAGSGGTWPAGSYSFLPVAGYNGTDFSDVDWLGYYPSGFAAWNNFTVGAGDTAKQLTVTWTAAGDLPDYYKILVQAGTSYDATAPGRVAATVAGTALTTTITAYPGSSPVITLAAAYSTMTLVPITLLPQARDSVRIGHDNSLGRQSYGTSTLYERIALQFFATTCTKAQYKTLQKWAQRNIHVKLDDQDTATYVNYWIGMLQKPNSLNSDSKNAGYPSMEFIVESEAYN